MPSSSECSHLEAPNPYTVFLASFILVGILVSYLPQHIKIIQNRSSEGLSPWWVLLGGLSAIAAIGNILVLPKSRQDVACCKIVSGGECAAALLGVGQIGLQFSCFMFIVLLFLIFFPTAPDTDLSSSTASLTKSPPPKRRDAVIVGVSMLVTLLVVGLASITMIAAFPSKTQAWANLLGSVAGTLAMIQYVPQIYFTWRRGNIGSLSIITMLIQVPGSFLFAFSLWLRVGWVGWATWLVYIVTGTLQGILLGLAIMYFFAGRKAAADRISVASEDEDEGATAEEREQATERTALLSNGHSAPSKTLPVRGETQRTSSGQNRQLSMLYAATPPDQDSESSSGNHRK